MARSPTPLDQLSDEQLVTAYRAGEGGAFELLLRRYHPELFQFLARFVGDRAAAEDLFQEAFLQVHQSIATFDPAKRFKPWLFTIAANKARDYLRKNSRRQNQATIAAVDASATIASRAVLASAPTPLERTAPRASTKR